MVLSHGSKREEANRQVLALVDRLRAELDTDLIQTAFLQLARPDLATGLAGLIDRGCNEIIVLALFLVSGNHQARDAEAAITKVLERYQGVKFSISQPLLASPDLYSFIEETVESTLRHGHAIPPSPQAIERKSLEMVKTRLAGLYLSEGERRVVERVIHATSDFSYAQTIRFSSGAVAAGVKALREGRSIITDTNMVRVGIRKGYQEQTLCAIDDPSVIEGASAGERTRASLAMERLAPSMDNALVVIGNAPTALLKVIELIKSKRCRPALVVGVPVGLVGALEAKLSLCQLEGQPYITNLARKGGSAAAVAIINALLKIAVE